jgi:anaerobic magnesium-protoporphyrin IX monomethyl ester cyclase
MRILLATLTWHDEPLGIMYLSAILKRRGHLVRGVMLHRENIFDVVQEFKPDMVGYSAMDCERAPIIKLNAQLKQKHGELFSIVGGPLTTFSPDIVDDNYVDAVCIGEGEEALLELVEALERSDDATAIKNIWIKVNGNVHRNPVRPLIGNLDAIPFPDRNLFAGFKQGALYNVVTSRGCPHDCTYCYNPKYKALYRSLDSHSPVRYRSVDNIIAELEGIKTDFDPAVFWFQEDHFYIASKLLYEFAEKYPAAIGKPFICSMRPEYLSSRKLVAALKKANCMAVFTGCESGNDHVRKAVLNRNLTNQQIIAAAETLQSFGIKVVFQNMVGIPTSSFQDDLETLELNVRCRPYYGWASICTPYLGTELYEIARRAGCIGKRYRDDLYETFHYRSSLDIPHARQVDILHKVFALVVEYPDLLPVVKSLEFYKDASEERIESLKQVFDAFKEFKYTSFSQAGLPVPDRVAAFLDAHSA